KETAESYGSRDSSARGRRRGTHLPGRPTPLPFGWVPAEACKKYRSGPPVADSIRSSVCCIPLGCLREDREERASVWRPERTLGPGHTQDTDRLAYRDTPALRRECF